MAIVPLGVLGGGKLITDAEEEQRKRSAEKGRATMRDWLRNPQEVAMSHALEKVANELGVKNITSGKNPPAYTRQYSKLTLQSYLSRHRVCYAEDHLCLPDYRVS